MVSDAELAARVHEFLRASDLKKTTNSIVRKKLEKDFGVDLSDRKPFLRRQVDRFLQNQFDDSEEDADEIDREHDADDDVSDSEVEGFHGGRETALRVQGSNGGSSFRAINKLPRLGEHKKEKKSKRSRSGNFCRLSPQLQKFLGVPSMARTEVVKQLSSYVKEKKLQDPVDGNNVICDETLRNLFGVDSINIVHIDKALTKHIWSSGSAVRSMRKEKQRKQEREEDPDGADSNMKRQKKVYSGFLAPLPLSDTLKHFLGTGEHELTRADVIKRVWEYIKHKNLQDPSDKKTVICDEKLRELFNVDSFHGFTVSKLLSAHFLKT